MWGVCVWQGVGGWSVECISHCSPSLLASKRSLSGGGEGGGGGAIKAEWVCWLVLPGVRTALSCEESTVCIACPKPPGKSTFTR